MRSASQHFQLNLLRLLIVQGIYKLCLAKVTHQVWYKRSDWVGLSSTPSSSAALLSWVSASSRCSSSGIKFIAWCERNKTLLSSLSQSSGPWPQRNTPQISSWTPVWKEVALGTCTPRHGWRFGQGAQVTQDLRSNPRSPKLDSPTVSPSATLQVEQV